MANKALQVGINNYKSINGLNGCINDVTNLRDILKSFFGFQNADIRTLIDNRATKAAQLDIFGNMVTGAKAGDNLIYHYSGHGSQIRDRNGDELSDHMDELICPYDMGWDDNVFIVDDDLAAIIKQLPKLVHLEVIFDSCHSGTATRGCNIGDVDDRRILNRYCPPPIDIGLRSEGEDLKDSPNRIFDCIRDIDPATTEKSIVNMNHVLWAGCRASQTCADAYIKGSYNGAFTYYFCKHIRDAGGKITRPELLKRVRASLKYDQYEQVPQLETNKAQYYNAVFSQ